MTTRQAAFRAERVSDQQGGYGTAEEVVSHPCTGRTSTDAEHAGRRPLAKSHAPEPYSCSLKAPTWATRR